MNLADAETRRLSSNILYLAGSAINSIKNDAGRADPKLGAEAMSQALDVHTSGELREVPLEKHLTVLIDISEKKKLKALREALRQRYGV
ncbi:MAG: hypothetical protein U0V70_09740 [Terriglobia bacterium]